MKVVVAGASGFIGRALCDRLSRDGYQVIALSRTPRAQLCATSVVWNPRKVGDWAQHFESAEAVINLSGAPITLRWTAENRKLILESRTMSTHTFGEAIAQCHNPPKVWINGSAIGYYGDRGDEVLTEQSSPGSGFLADTCRKWEEAVVPFDIPQTRKAQIRIGIVLGNGGGGLPTLTALTKYFLGGTAGRGDQYQSWIHLDDLVGLMKHAMLEPISGPINGTAPNPVTNRELMETLRSQMSRPWSPPVPSFALNLVGKLIGPDSELLLESARVIPQRALESNYQFRYPDLREALQDILTPQPR